MSDAVKITSKFNVGGDLTAEERAKIADAICDELSLPYGATKVATNPRPREARVRNRFLWPVRFLLDRNDDPSSTKIMAYLVLASNWTGHPLEPWTCALLLATCFGYSMFKSVIEKSTMTATATGAVNLAASFKKELSERVDKVFTYTKNGEPTHSLPAQPDARTPGGGD